MDATTAAMRIDNDRGRSTASQETDNHESSSPPSSTKFEIDQSILRWKGKESVIHKAFDAAAFAVLRAMLLQQQDQQGGGAFCLPVLSGSHSITEISTTSSTSFLNNWMKEISLAQEKALNLVSEASANGTNNSSNVSGSGGSGAKKRKRVSGGTGASPMDNAGTTSDTCWKKQNNAALSVVPSSSVASALSSSPGPSSGKTDTQSSSRSNLSKAILCAVATFVFKELTPPCGNEEDVDVLNVPQNKAAAKNKKVEPEEVDRVSQPASRDVPILNMGQVTLSAEIFAKRIIEQVRGTVIRNERRRQWRMICARSDLAQKERQLCLSSYYGSNRLDRYLKWKDFSRVTVDSEVPDDDVSSDATESDHDDDDGGGGGGALDESTSEKNEEWTLRCLPRILSIMRHGSGNVIFHDEEWSRRFERVMQVLASLGKMDSGADGKGAKENNLDLQSNHGPHLILTTDMDIDAYMHVLGPISYGVEKMSDAAFVFSLRGLRYHGSSQVRQHLRQEHFRNINFSGLYDAPFSVIVTTYQTFLQDYAHFCQIPFQVVVMDDGMSWLSVAHLDPNGQLGKVYNTAMWSKSDNYAGLAGVNKDWDFSADVAPDGTAREGTTKSANLNFTPLTGLTARYRLIVASSMHSKYGDVIYKAPVPAIMSFIFPQFFEVVKEEWDRNKMNNCKESIEYIRTLLSRVLVVYTGSDDKTNCSHGNFSLAMAAMLGRESGSKRSDDIYAIKSTAQKVMTENLIADGKIMSSRRFVSSWLRSSSPIRWELGTASLTPFIDALKNMSMFGYQCEDVVATASLKTNASSGDDLGSLLFRPASRCGRKFTTEQGLRQHVAAFHAPPGTWLCRTCAVDCGTSQARTHHERSCGNKKNDGFAVDCNTDSPLKKKMNIKGEHPRSVDKETRDVDGNLRVPGYKGVWVNSDGKYFIKIDGAPSTHEEKGFLHDDPDTAARKYDELMKRRPGKLELNFNQDGTRIQYDDSSSTSIHGKGFEVFGTSSTNVVPALSVINIKDLPQGVVPLLRDPRQISRSGGNMKRHVYKYRGVCRQARKGHDRWQSQISFGGHNHYLGTFDTEWEAAAVYAWAHLILYGEEATKKAQREGEEAVATYQRQLENGNIEDVPQKVKKETPKQEGKKRNKVYDKDKKASPLPSNLKQFYTKKTSGDKPGVRDLVSLCVERIVSTQSRDTWENSRCMSVAGMLPSEYSSGCALLVGLCSEEWGWKPEDFVKSVKSCVHNNGDYLMALLKSETSLNTRFKTVVRGIPCFIGKAPQVSEQAAATLGPLGKDVGEPIGIIDCNIGGMSGSCGEIACCITYSSSQQQFMIASCNDNDIVTLNGERLHASTGPRSVINGDVCSVGSRVFMFILPA